MVVPGQPLLCPPKHTTLAVLTCQLLVPTSLHLYSVLAMSLAFVFISHFICNGITVDDLGMLLIAVAVFILIVGTIYRPTVGLFRFLWIIRPDLNRFRVSFRL